MGEGTAGSPGRGGALRAPHLLQSDARVGLVHLHRELGAHTLHLVMRERASQQSWHHASAPSPVPSPAPASP